MHYFFLEGQSLSPGVEVELAEQDISHAHRVLRLKKGDRIAVSDSLGTALSGYITTSEPALVRVFLDYELPSAESSLQITLFQALSKGDKMELIIRQAVELGVKKFVPVATMRSIPRLDNHKQEKKNKRWQNIARSAAAQCRRAFLPPVEDVQDLRTVLEVLRKHRTLVPWEEESSISLSGALKQPCPEDRAVFLFIGPEGGFEISEIEAVREAGAEVVHLGPRILRTETAAAAAVTIIQLAWGDLEERGRR